VLQGTRQLREHPVLLHGVEGGQVADTTASEMSVRSHLQQELS
jgi:hypothetical protein